ncbi:MAG: nitroreductase family protein [Treponema sp.]|nr:nitroreductase family protein [Treponema sp.]
MKDFFETAAHRSSVRSFAPQPIEPGEWEKLLRAAMAAPSAVNRQPWEFIIIENRATLDALAEALPYAKMARHAPGAVLVCADPLRAHQGKVEYAVLDASAACENLLLAADALGLGAVWTAVYPQADRQAVVRKLLGIPEGIIPLALVPVGHPKGEQRPQDKYKPELIHREGWKPRDRPLDMPPPDHD